MTFSLIILKIATCILIVFVSRHFTLSSLKGRFPLTLSESFLFREHFPKPPHLVASVRLKTLTRKERRRVKDLFSHFLVTPRARVFFHKGLFEVKYRFIPRINVCDAKLSLLVTNVLIEKITKYFVIDLFLRTAYWGA